MESGIKKVKVKKKIRIKARGRVRYKDNINAF
jgi:hypothetical protein